VQSATGDDDTLARFVFDYSMTAGGTSNVTDIADPSMFDRLIGGWEPFTTTLGAVLPWLTALACFAAVSAYAATRRGAGS
jgi:hypothetical protein